MLFGLGITDSGYLAEMKYQRYSLSHQVTDYRNERFATQYIGVEDQVHKHGSVRFLAKMRIGLEYHYESQFYARNYLVISPELGLRFPISKTLGIQAFSAPVKFFRRLTDQNKFSVDGFRWDPNLCVSLTFSFPKEGATK